MENQLFYRINGMHSEECIRKVIKALKKIGGDGVVDIDLETGMASIKTEIADEEVTAAILEAGYNAVLVSD